jgi:hypothetical protein
VTRDVGHGSSPGVGCLAWLVVMGLVPGCGAAVLATCTANEAAIVALPCGPLSAAECRQRDTELLRVERARCDAEMAGVP